MVQYCSILYDMTAQHFCRISWARKEAVTGRKRNRQACQAAVLLVALCTVTYLLTYSLASNQKSSLLLLLLLLLQLWLPLLLLRRIRIRSFRFRVLFLPLLHQNIGPTSIMAQQQQQRFQQRQGNRGFLLHLFRCYNSHYSLYIAVVIVVTVFVVDLGWIHGTPSHRSVRSISIVQIGIG